MNSMFTRILHILRERERREQMQVAIGAEAWLKSEPLNVAIAKMRADTIDNWRKSRDPETRERAWLMIQSIDLFVSNLAQLVSNEQVEQAKEAKRDDD